MDSNRFDTFVRSLGHAVPRRAALVGALGTGLGGLLTHVGMEIADARKRKKKKKCKGGKKKCGKKCFDLQTDTLHCGSCNLACAVDESCVDGVCTCPTGQADCGDGCIDVQADTANCGACGNACGSGQICITGLCLTTCENPSPQSPLTFCPADPGGFCATVDGIAVCVLGENNCPPFARESCDGPPCPDGRVCANLVCGLPRFSCLLPA